MTDNLWRDLLQVAPAFEARFKTLDDCRAYWIKARWGGKPACPKYKCMRAWTIDNGTTFESAECGHQNCLTSSVLLEKTTKPVKVLFLAEFEISASIAWISLG